MAPEQARGEPTSPASDRYALACVAFELLTGRRPFERESPAAEATAHAREAGAVGARPRARAYRQRSTPSSRAASPSGPRSGTRPAQRLSLTCARGPRRRGRPQRLRSLPRRRVRTVHHTTRYRSRPPRRRCCSPGSRARWPPVRRARLGAERERSRVLELDRRAHTGRCEGEERTVVVTETTDGGDGRANRDGRTASPSPRPLPAGDSGIALNDRGFRLLQAGDAQGGTSRPRVRGRGAARLLVDHRGVRLVQPRAQRALRCGRCDVVPSCSTVRSRSRATGRRSTDSASRPRGAARTPPMETRNGR